MRPNMSTGGESSVLATQDTVFCLTILRKPCLKWVLAEFLQYNWKGDSLRGSIKQRSIPLSTFTPICYFATDVSDALHNLMRCGFPTFARWRISWLCRGFRRLPHQREPFADAPQP